MLKEVVWLLLGILVGVLLLPLLALAGLAFLATWILAPIYVPIVLIALGVLLIIIGIAALAVRQTPFFLFETEPLGMVRLT